MIEIEIAPAVVEILAIDDSSEAQLVDEVGNLWLVHSQAQSSLSKTRDDLKLLRTDLSRRLHALKSLLARPGRGGAWHSFLQAQKIPRSSADRLVRAYEKTISADDNCTSDQIPETNEMVVQRYVRALWPKLSRILKTRESVRLFTAELLRISEKSFADPSPAKSSGIPSYLLHLNLPLSAASANAAHS
jgi:hypothetical protein